ncbi:MAG: homoserine kinase [Gammaproteobacteria bacterium]
MSVYTEVPRAALDDFLKPYALGAVLAFEGILEGVENTNYFLTTSVGAYVLTLFEATPPASLPYCLALMTHLAARGIPAPLPLAARDGSVLGSLCGRPAALVARLPGASVARPTLAQCAAIGAVLGRMHLAVADFGPRRDGTRGADWRAATAARLAARLGSADLALVAEEVALQAGAPLAGLPGGAVHGDLFHDNVLFAGDALTGVIDFYYAAHEAFVYDVAVTVADWCFSAGRCDEGRARALLGAYRATREISRAEIEAWPLALRAAGLRFWLSRLHDALFRKPGELVLIKDPAACRAVVLAARREPERLRRCWGQSQG